ncbi:hypothetical protein [Pseudochrobactrum kiredjianiae]|uniref:DUF982 domain-containing protein n=1 Tax=Pseudochrobactrum kiredjianiae TaxID=386305 RepID=A0ABW3V827_9HYPH|nr:hypothetical protein [Pseudochrobactrum kiredjianiae]MDM7850167.1 hypothetical protein [Pseudochrobactrum kiredjianiae]
MSEVNEPVIKPYRTSNGMYLLHPEFISGLIAQISWQCINPTTGEADLAAGAALFQKAAFLLCKQVETDVLQRGGTTAEAEYHAQEMFTFFDAGAIGIQ